MKKNNMISIRVSEEEKNIIAIIKRYDSEFNASNFFRKNLFKKLEEIKEQVGASVGFFEIAPEKTKTEEKQSQNINVQESKTEGDK